jgi:hypothetical protein
MAWTLFCREGKIASRPVFETGEGAFVTGVPVVGSVLVSGVADETVLPFALVELPHTARKSKHISKSSGKKTWLAAINRCNGLVNIENILSELRTIDRTHRIVPNRHVKNVVAC